MPKASKSQWEMGELFPVEEVRKVLTVSELTGAIRRVLEKEVGQVWVTGEITNLRVQGSGHVYFSIKDANAQLSCVLFRTEARSVNRDFLTDGQRVILQGELTVYEARGQYQLRVASVQLHGVGALQAAFERLKQKLQAEGLFDQGHKRPLPSIPQAIGLVTSPDAAALRDVLHTVRRRNPALRIVLACCRVQGIGAAQEIAEAIHALNSGQPPSPVDLIMLTRGGGSIEDLWAFNEEIVARAIYASKIPVVSAVGHEIDFTISDFVADFRAATPTAGAEIVTEGVFSRRQYVAGAPAYLRELVAARLTDKRARVQAASRLLSRAHPRRRLRQGMQRADDLQNSLARCARHHLRQTRSRMESVLNRFSRLRPELVLNLKRERLRWLASRLEEAPGERIGKMRERLRAAEMRLRLLSPLHTLSRGYSITTDAATGAIIRSPKQTRTGQELRSQLDKGEVRSIVR